MLLTTRKVGDSIRIGDDIVLHILPSLVPDQARIGIEAPSDVKILRAELEPYLADEQEGE